MCDGHLTNQATGMTEKSPNFACRFPEKCASSLVRLVLYTVWRALHALISLYCLVVQLAQRFLQMFSCARTLFCDITRKDDLPRVPTHLGLVFTERPDRFSIDQLSDVISWSAKFGISYLSVYDPEGEWKNNRLLVEASLQRRHGSCQRSAANIADVCYAEPLKTCSDLDRLEFAGTNVVFLSEMDGKATIAFCAGEVCRDVASRAVPLDAVDQSLLELYLQRRQTFPDPELVLKIGRLNSLSGYLPWHTRLTEIIFCPSVSSISYTEFVGYLRRFGRVEQRFGR